MHSCLTEVVIDKIRRENKDVWSTHSRHFITEQTFFTLYYFFFFFGEMSKFRTVGVTKDQVE